MVFFIFYLYQISNSWPKNESMTTHTGDRWDSFEIKWVEKDGWSKTYNMKGWINSPIYVQIIHYSNVTIQPSYKFCHVREFMSRYQLCVSLFFILPFSPSSHKHGIRHVNLSLHSLHYIKHSFAIYKAKELKIHLHQFVEHNNKILNWNTHISVWFF
jgi:hypothetical protein